MFRRSFISLLAAPFLRRQALAGWRIAKLCGSVGLQAGGAAAERSSAAASPISGGYRQFVLGLYNLPNVPDPWREAREAGCNLIHVSPSKQEFDRAREHGLCTWVSLGSISEKNRAADEARIRGIVEQFRHDPALLFWETEDEPAYIWKSLRPRVPPEQIIATHDFVRRLDPVHPLYLNHAPVNLESTLRKYNPGAEIIATDIYPVIPHGIREMYALWPSGEQGDLLNATISQVGEYTDKMRRVAGPSQAVYMVLQAFAWEDLREKDRDPKMVLYPDRAQLKSMAYQAIIHGADGLLYWGLASTPANAPLWNDLRSVLREVAQLAPEIAAPTVASGFSPARAAPSPLSEFALSEAKGQALKGGSTSPQKVSLRIEYHDTGHSLDRGIEWTARSSGDGLLLLAANAARNPVEATLTLPVVFQSCEIVGTKEVIPLSHGAMEQSFAPFEAKALRLR